MRRVLRESFPDGWPGEMYGSVWSSWRPLLYPIQEQIWFKRSDHVRRIHRGPGVYELALSDSNNQRLCVYLGKTANVRRRAFSYAWRGSHLSPLLHRALMQGCCVDFRYLSLETEARAKLVESLTLARFDYAWNVDLNGSVRTIGDDDGCPPQRKVESRFFALPCPATADTSRTSSFGIEPPDTATASLRTSFAPGTPSRKDAPRPSGAR